MTSISSSLGAQVFCKIDLQSCYHWLKLKNKDMSKIAFLTHFKLTNASVAFIDLMNRVFKLYLDEFVVAFIGDILVYSPSLIQHEEHLRIVLRHFEAKTIVC